MATKTKTSEWKELARDEQGYRGQPGSQYHDEGAIVERKGARYRVRILDRWGSNQGYLEQHGGQDREYRADSLAELMRIALAAEQQRQEPNQDIMTAIRQAIYAAEDVDE